MRAATILFLLLAGCRASQVDPAREQAEVSANGPCTQRLFEEVRFTVCGDPKARIELHSAGPDDVPLRGFAALQSALGVQASYIAFAMNAGMFDEEGRAIGLLIENGRQLHAINRRKGGGNFHLLPNGVFLVRKDGRAEVVTSDAFSPSPTIAYATQSGPMLLIQGKLHPKFDEDGESRLIRNGVGIGPDGTLLFVISEDPVSFGKFARFYRDALHAREALYFDGSVSSLWDPADHRIDSHAELGPMVVAFREETRAR